MQQTHTKSTEGGRSAPWIVYVLLLLTLLLYALASFLPKQRLWGVNHLAYYPIALRVVALAAMALSLVPRVSGALFAVFDKCLEWVRRRRRIGVVLIIGLSLATVWLFYAMRSETLLLGDGEVVAGTMTTTYVGESHDVSTTLRGIAMNTPTAPGATMLFYLVSIAGAAWADPVTIMRLLSCLLGGVFVFVILRAAILADVSNVLSGWLLVFVLASGAMQLFVGYVENYALLCVVGAVYVIAAIRTLHGRGRLWIPVALFVLASVAHVSGVLLGGSLILVVARRITGERRVLRIVTLSLMILMAAAAIVASRIASLGGFFLPLLSRDAEYSVLSGRHIVDVANEILLLVPVLPAVVGLALVSRGEPVSSGETEPVDRTRVGWLERRVEWYFVLLVLFATSMYLVWFNPVIGLGRDWDLASILILGLAPWGLLVINRSTRSLDIARRTFGSALVICVVMASAWIGVNASTDRATRRFEDILVYQENRRDYAYEVLAKTYFENGRLPDAIRAQEKAIAISHNVRQQLALVHYYREYHDVDASIGLLERIVERKPDYWPARRELIIAMFNHGRFLDAIDLTQSGLTYHPEDAFYYYYLGKSLVRLDRLDEGRSALLKARDLGSGPRLSQEIADELARLHDLRVR